MAVDIHPGVTKSAVESQELVAASGSSSPPPLPAASSFDSGNAPKDASLVAHLELAHNDESSEANARRVLTEAIEKYFVDQGKHVSWIRGL